MIETEVQLETEQDLVTVFNDIYRNVVKPALKAVEKTLQTSVEETALSMG